jgi:hypothetical protein
MRSMLASSVAALIAIDLARVVDPARAAAVAALPDFTLRPRRRVQSPRADFIDVHAAARAARRADRYRRRQERIGAVDAVAPRHIDENERDAWRFIDRQSVQGQAAEIAAREVVR